MMWLHNGRPTVKKSLRICLVVLTEYRRVTDGQTSGDTVTIVRAGKTEPEVRWCDIR